MLKKNNIICAVDMGSSKLTGLVATFGRGSVMKSVSVAAVPSRGMRNGHIANFSELSASLDALLKSLQKKSGVTVHSFYTNVPGNEITTRHSKAIMPLMERGNRVITDADIARIKGQAKVLGTTLQEEIIHEVAYGYVVDGENFCTDPKELYAHRLEIDLGLIYAKLAYIQSMTRLAGQLGYTIKGFFYPGYVNRRLVFNGSGKHIVEALCDIGADTTEIILYKDGIIQSIEVLPFGGDTITEALAEEFSIPFALAQDIKHSWAAVAAGEEVKDEKEIMVKRGRSYQPISQKEISRVANERVALVCTQIKDCLQKMSAQAKVSNLVITGRTAIQDGFIEKLEELTGLSVRLVRIADEYTSEKEIRNELASSCVKTLSNLNAFGIAMHAWDKTRGNGGKPVVSLRSFAGIKDAVKYLYQQYF